MIADLHSNMYIDLINWKMPCFWYRVMYYNVSWVMEFLTYGYKISLILSKKKWLAFNEIAVFFEKKVPKLYFQSQFSMPKNMEFEKKNENINFWAHFCKKKTFYSWLQFSDISFSKIRPQNTAISLNSIHFLIKSS